MSRKSNKARIFAVFFFNLIRRTATVQGWKTWQSSGACIVAGQPTYSCIVVPMALVPKFGRREIWKGLKTAKRSEAEALHLKEPFDAFGPTRPTCLFWVVSCRKQTGS